MTEAIPPGFSTVNTSFTFKDSRKAIAFYEAAFGAQLLSLFPHPHANTVMHATLKIGQTTLMMGDEMPGSDMCKSAETLGGSPISLYVYVQDVDSAFQKAVDAGGKVIMPVADMFWGDRSGMIRDPFGYDWTIATHTRDLTEEQVIPFLDQ